MGASWGSRIVVGVPLAEVYSEQLTEKELTKYNPDTGEPFKKKMHVLERKFMGKPLPDLQPIKSYLGDHYADIRRDWDFLEGSGLEVFFFTDSMMMTQESYKTALVGVQVGRGTSDRRHVDWTVPVDESKDLVFTVAHKLYDLGYRIGTPINPDHLTSGPRVYMQLTVSG